MAFEYVQTVPPAKTRITAVSETHAADLLKGYTRDPAGALARMRDNPYGQLRCEGGTIRWNPKGGEEA